MECRWFLGCLYVSCISVVLVVGALYLLVIAWSVVELDPNGWSIFTELDLVGRGDAAA